MLQNSNGIDYLNIIQVHNRNVQQIDVSCLFIYQFELGLIVNT